MSAQPEPRIYTAEEYLAFEGASLERHEFIDGRIYAMSGGRIAHSGVAVNIIVALGTALRGRGCRVFNSDMRVKVAATGAYTYPDVAALCGRPELEDARGDSLLNPSLIVEVLSPSTEGRDRNAKFDHYTQIPALREYLLVAQDRVHVERYVRGVGVAWACTPSGGIGDVVDLPSLGTTLALRDVYEDVEFVERPRVVREAPESAYAEAPRPPV